MLDSLLVSLWMAAAVGSGSNLPFWATAGQFDRMPEHGGAISLVSAEFSHSFGADDAWKINGGAAFAGRIDMPRSEDGSRTADFSAIVDELYAEVGWKTISLNLGMRHEDLDFWAAGSRDLGSVSLTGGRIIRSGNSRALPGYELRLRPTAIPFTGGRAAIYGAYADYKMMDQRYVEGALLHNMKAGLCVHLSSRLDFHFILDHYAQWGGVSPVSGEMPLTLDNYLRVITGRHASSAGTTSDQINVIGNQLGSETLRLDWRGEGWRASLLHDIPYEDGSGMGFQNFPDGVNTLWFGWDDKDRWITDIALEFVYTRWQSGPRHDRPTTDEEKASMDPSCGLDYYRRIIGGVDNYFCNSEYRSAWTYFGRTIGLPLFYPAGTHDGSWERGITLGVENNRIRAWHLGLGGRLFRLAPYRLMLTYSQNYGTYFNQYAGPSAHNQDWGTVREVALNQFSACLNGEVPLFSGRAGVSLRYGLYADLGEVLESSFGAMFGIAVNFY